MNYVSGTEYDSAISIFVSGIELLEKKGSSFIFATHLHKVVEYDEIKILNNIKIYHMSVKYNYETKKINI